MHKGKLSFMATWMLGFVLLVPSVSTAQVSQKAKDYNKKYQMEKEEARDKAECFATVKRCERHIVQFTGESRTYMTKQCGKIKSVCEGAPIPLTTSKAYKTYRKAALESISKELCYERVNSCGIFAQLTFAPAQAGWLVGTRLPQKTDPRVR